MADLNSACSAAANALQALSHLQPGFASNVSPRLTENQREQSTNTQLSGADPPDFVTDAEDLAGIYRVQNLATRTCPA